MTIATVTARADGALVYIVLKGEIDLANADDVERDIHAAITNHVTDVVIDLEGTTYIDSIGLRILFSLATRLQSLEIRLKLVAPAGSVARRIVDLSGLSSVVSLDE